ncbi:hypothetical protein OCOJLMKI_5191 [Methylobacterium iners]|uniref:Uncharacterized protein n=1 Tax=Methylobacterium iners TaxID=418707 RepID=A0ABQ4S757_9HYPH|nr:hypothetical protein OCOJLMKI_5191 [Methylobacterium iners]
MIEDGAVQNTDPTLIQGKASSSIIEELVIERHAFVRVFDSRLADDGASKGVLLNLCFAEAQFQIFGNADGELRRAAASISGGRSDCDLVARRCVVVEGCPRRYAHDTGRLIDDEAALCVASKVVCDGARRRVCIRGEDANADSTAADCVLPNYVCRVIDVLRSSNSKLVDVAYGDRETFLILLT